MKRRVRLTELDLHRIVKESVKRILRENWEDDYWNEQPFNKMYEDLLNNAEFFVKVGRRLKSIVSEKIKRYDMQNDALDEMETDSSIVSSVCSRGTNVLKCGWDKEDTVYINVDSVIYVTTDFYIAKDDKVCWHDELGNYPLDKQNDGFVCIKFDRNALREYFDEKNSHRDFKNDPRYIELKNNYLMQQDRERQEREEKKKADELAREKERQRVISRIQPPTDKVKKQMDDMWKEHDKFAKSKTDKEMKQIWNRQKRNG